MNSSLCQAPQSGSTIHHRRHWPWTKAHADAGDDNGAAQIVLFHGSIDVSKKSKTLLAANTDGVIGACQSSLAVRFAKGLYVRYDLIEATIVSSNPSKALELDPWWCKESVNQWILLQCVISNWPDFELLSLSLLKIEVESVWKFHPSRCSIYVDHQVCWWVCWPQATLQKVKILQELYLPLISLSLCLRLWWRVFESFTPDAVKLVSS